MPCTDPVCPPRDGTRLPRTAALLMLLAGCSSPMPPMAPVANAPAARPAAQPTPPGQPVAPKGAAASPAVAAPAPGQRPARNWDEYRVRAAHRLVAANRSATYDGAVPEPLLAIPVLEIELHADGSVRQIKVMRHPTQAKDTVQLAIDAVQRAAPFGEVSHLPKPWKFNEVFLFDDSRRFKPRTLDL